jgi:hypothetical protein
MILQYSAKLAIVKNIFEWLSADSEVLWLPLIIRKERRPPLSWQRYLRTSDLRKPQTIGRNVKHPVTLVAHADEDVHKKCAHAEP